MTLADRLTLSRVLLIPPLLLLMAHNQNRAALALYALAAITDYADGKVARARQEFSDFGRMLDPIADKLLVAAILLLAADLGRLSAVGLVAAEIILLRELLISGVREHAAQQARSIPVSRLAKYKTTAQMLGAGGILATGIWPALATPTDALLALAAALTAITAYQYLRP